jgi:AraC family transcriptional regulator
MEGITSHLDTIGFDYRKFADSAGYSVAQTYRNAHKMGMQKPMTTRRRILLERAAWSLPRVTQTISEIAMDAGYESVGGFSRAFSTAFGISPSLFRKLAPGSNPIARQGNNMKLIQTMLETHHQTMLQILDTIEEHPELKSVPLSLTNPIPWNDSDETVEQLVRRACTGQAPWLHAIQGYQLDETKSQRTLTDEQYEGIKRLVNEIEQDGTWDVTFIDADCNPPETFSYLRVVQHILSLNEHARLTLILHLQRLGLNAPATLPPHI